MAGYGPRRLQGEEQTIESSSERWTSDDGVQGDIFTGELPRVVAGVVVPEGIKDDPEAYHQLAAQIGQLLDRSPAEILAG